VKPAQVTLRYSERHFCKSNFATRSRRCARSAHQLNCLQRKRACSIRSLDRAGDRLAISSRLHPAQRRGAHLINAEWATTSPSAKQQIAHRERRELFSTPSLMTSHALKDRDLVDKTRAHAPNKLAKTVGAFSKAPLGAAITKHQVVGHSSHYTEERLFCRRPALSATELIKRGAAWESSPERSPGGRRCLQSALSAVAARSVLHLPCARCERSGFPCAAAVCGEMRESRASGALCICADWLMRSRVSSVSQSVMSVALA
jgi:hypothetical protein